MADKKNINKLITLTPRLMEMIEEIQEKKGYISCSSVVQQGVVELHKSFFPAYIQKDSSPEGRVKRKQLEEEAKKQLEVEKLTKICNVLGGEVVDKNGTEYCNYYTYNHKKRYEQSVPVEQLTEDLPKNQYSPTKAKVLENQKNGKVDYKL